MQHTMYQRLQRTIGGLGQELTIYFHSFSVIMKKMHHSYTTCLECHIQQLLLWEFKHSCESSPAESMACLITIRIPNVLSQLLLSRRAKSWFNPICFVIQSTSSFWVWLVCCCRHTLLFQGLLPAGFVPEPSVLPQQFPPSNIPSAFTCSSFHTIEMLQSLLFKYTVN